MKGSRRSETASYTCHACGYRSPRWMGFCPQCRSQTALDRVQAEHAAVVEDIEVVGASQGTSSRDQRQPIGIGEFDRVLGGGVVAGGAVLVGGEPGVGKSTLLLQAADHVAAGPRTVLYVSAEESPDQVQMRWRRIGGGSTDVDVASIGDVDGIIAVAAQRRPGMLVVDSIQTVSTGDVGGAAGGVAQVRESAANLIGFAKTSGTPTVLVGHVTKDGAIAGPRTLEHMVDVVLYLEGESEEGLRFLRCVKNRFGSVNEVGVFTMTAEGLAEVPDPSGLLIGQRDAAAAGTVLFPTLEGRRPVVVEIQALVVDSDATQPRRAVTGLPASRVHQVLGVVERVTGLPLRKHEVYVSVMGGVKLDDPAADLAVALAVVSAAVDVPLGDTAAWGEVGLTGEIRSVSRSGLRHAEVDRLGAGPALSPESHRRLSEAIRATGLAS